MPVPVCPARSGRPPTLPSTRRRQAPIRRHSSIRRRSAIRRRSPVGRRLCGGLRRLAAALPTAAVVLVVAAGPAVAAPGGPPSLAGVIDNLRGWLVGLLAAVATLFLTIGGLRYLTAGGDPSQVERAKTALKSAAIGYVLAALAPVLVSILASLVGG